LLLDLMTEEGIMGRSYIFCYLPMVAIALRGLLDQMLALVKGDEVVPYVLGRKLAGHFRLVGSGGIISMALAALDMAFWDSIAVAAGVPLSILLGGTPVGIQGYNSNGLGMMPAAAAADEAEELLAGGFRAIKLRLGHPTAEKDVEVTRAVRQRVPSRIHLMVDYNQALTPAEAVYRGRLLDQESIYWIEEPIRHDDYLANAAVARELKTPVQLGENLEGLLAVTKAISAQATDYLMFDVQRVGGVTGWLQAISVAAAARIEVSSHLYPEISVHLLSITPTCHWLEYVDWASPILIEPLRVVDGLVVPLDAPGIGLRWNYDAVARYRIS
ncbi:MAG TPA: enolase C-terminal domain-like protein, partial [Chthoniobacterales bacterium]|nr:enolase C-terminal domain-like protein [Chthoniobacterales bacterium]